MVGDPVEGDDDDDCRAAPTVSIWVETDAERIKRLIQPTNDGAPWVMPDSTIAPSMDLASQLLRSPGT